MFLQSITKKNAVLSVCQISLLMAPQLTGAIKRIQLVEKTNKGNGANGYGRLMHRVRRGRLAPFEGWCDPHRTGIVIGNSVKAPERE